jgi:hypothetical protein
MPPDRSGLTWFAGWDVHGGAGRQGAAVALALSESVAESAVEIYELLAVAARGFRPPALLTIARAAGDDPPWELDAEGQAWSLLYRLIAESNPRESAPYAIYLLGVNPPTGATDEDLKVFNDFYTNVHLREVAERRRALRAVRYELVRSVKAPFKGAPRYLAVYEVDEESASQRRHVGPPYSSGPAVWQGHRTPWRLWFRTAGQ